MVAKAFPSLPLSGTSQTPCLADRRGFLITPISYGRVVVPRKTNILMLFWCLFGHLASATSTRNNTLASAGLGSSPPYTGQHSQLPSAGVVINAASSERFRHPALSGRPSSDQHFSFESGNRKFDSVNQSILLIKLTGKNSIELSN